MKRYVVRTVQSSRPKKKTLIGTTVDWYAVNYDDLQDMIQEECNSMDDEGYEVFSVDLTVRGEKLVDSGWSVTDGAVIVGKLRS